MKDRHNEPISTVNLQKVLCDLTHTMMKSVETLVQGLRCDMSGAWNLIRDCLLTQT